MRAANLGMYDAPFMHAANDAFWAAVRDRLRAAGLAGVPPSLDRSRALDDLWRDPGLLLGQTCGYPLLTRYAGSLRLVATPVYELPGCDGPLYRSFLLVRADDPCRDLAALRGRRCAMNGRDSNSGMNVLRALVAPLARNGRFFGEVVTTGGHLRSIAALQAGTADVAAIDCVTHGLAARHRPDLLAGTRVLMESTGTPGLPFVTAAASDDATCRLLGAALSGAIADGAGAPLALAGLRALTVRDYEVLLDLERAAAAAGYPDLA